jgi:hypothetical protein
MQKKLENDLVYKKGKKNEAREKLQICYSGIKSSNFCPLWISR